MEEFEVQCPQCGWAGMYSELVAWFDNPLNKCPECAGWDEWVEVEDLKGGLDEAANRRRRYSLDFVNYRKDKERRFGNRRFQNEQFRND